MKKSENPTRQLLSLYKNILPEISSRINSFQNLWENGKSKEIFAELVFCILTPQSKAKSCWNAVENLIRKGILLEESKGQVLRELYGVRFKYKKAEYIIRARRQFTNEDKILIISKIKKFNNVYGAREWLVKSTVGIGYKEASHFLRNIGYGMNLAILDRHILKNLEYLGIIDRIPISLTPRKYFDIEKKMQGFAERVKIPVSHLDLLLWYKETGEVFK